MSKCNPIKRQFTTATINIPRKIRRLLEQLQITPAETIQHDVLYTEWRLYKGMLQDNWIISPDQATRIHNTLLNPLLRGYYLMRVSLLHHDRMLERQAAGDLDSDADGVYMSLYRKTDALLTRRLERAGSEIVEQLHNSKLEESLN